MATIRESVRVRAPLQMAYNQWARFDDFPRFIRGVREVRKLDDRRLHWKAQLDGNYMEWDSEITQHIPDNLIEWRTVGGPEHGGAIELRPAGAGEIDVSIQIDYAPETLGSPLSIAKQMHSALENYRQLVEARASSGANAFDAVAEGSAQESCEDD